MNASAGPPSLMTVLCSVTADVAVVELNRPEKLNALDDQMADDLQSALDWAGWSGCRAVLLAATSAASTPPTTTPRTSSAGR